MWVEVDVGIDIDTVEEFIKKASDDELRRLRETLDAQLPTSGKLPEFEQLYKELDLFGTDAFLKLFLKMARQKGIEQTYAA